jgi:hypothetical protein
MDEHLIFFIDILGFQKAVSTWEKEGIERLTEVLHDLASWRSGSGYSQTPGSPQIHLTTAVTTFSDHIVISYRTEHLRNLIPEELFVPGRP